MRRALKRVAPLIVIAVLLSSILRAQENTIESIKLLMDSYENLKDKVFDLLEEAEGKVKFIMKLYTKNSRHTL